MVRLLSAVVLGACGVAIGAPPEKGVFELPADPATSALVTVGESMPPGPVPSVAASSPMLLNLQGFVGGLTGVQAAQLGKCVRTAGKTPAATPEFKRLGVVHLLDGRGNDGKRVELLVGPEGVTLARELGSVDGKGGSAAFGRTVALDPERFLALSNGWTRYRGPLGDGVGGLVDPEGAAPLTTGGGGVVEMSKPIAPPPVFLDEKTFGDRFISGGRANVLKVARKLEGERFFIRPPVKLDPRTPAGLLIYINAASDGRPPEVLFKACDELGVVCVGIENAGNDRPVVDRFQLVIDALFAASARAHVDPRRVYLSGISGGGRCSTRLQCCFPDYFTGAAPIVGTSAWFDVPLGNNKHAPSAFDRPSSARFALLRTRRIGVLTGPADFNYGEIVTTAKRMNDDRVQMRVFEHEMGHQLPTADWFNETLAWVDGPYQETLKKEAADAQATLDAYIKKWGDNPPPAKDGKARDELVKVTRVGPWSDAAWKAVRLLGVSKR